MTIFFEFLAILAAVYGCTVVAYFALGWAIDWMNARNPDRRIQKTRRNDKRKAAEIRMSFVSLFVASLSLSVALTAQRAGWAPAPWTLTWVNAVPLMLLTLFLYDLWFYLAHRLLHTRLFYRFHRFHHRSVAPSPWSNDAIDPVDTLICQGFYMVVVFVLPIPPLILIANRIYDHVNGTFGHAGFEYFAGSTTRFPSLMLCTTYHDQHHEKFRYNYANYFSLWDRVFGTVDPQYDSRVRSIETGAEKIKFR